MIFSALSSRSLAKDAAKDKEADEAFSAQKEKYEAEKSKEAFERLDSIIAFGEVNSPKTVPFLIEILDKEENPAIRGAILKALGKRGTVEAAQAIVQKGIPLLIGDLNFFYVGEALQGPLDPKAEKWLIKNGLTSAVRKDPEALKTVIQAIAGLKDSSRFSVLAEELHNKASTPELQVVILNTLRDHKPKSAASEAIRLANSPNSQVQIAALETLLATEAKGYTGQYLKLLRHKDWQVRALAADLLVIAKDPKHLKQLLPLLNDPDERVRVSAVAALMEIGSAEVIEPLIKAMERSKGRVLDDLADALTRLTGENLGTNSAQWDSWWGANKDKAEIRLRSHEEFTALKSQAVPSAGQTAVLTYHGIPVLSEKVVFIIDTSESMQETYGAVAPDKKGEEKKEDKKNEGAKPQSQPKPAGPEEPVKPGKPEKPDQPGGKAPKKPAPAAASKMDVAKKEFLKVLGGMKEGTSINVISFNTFVQPWRPHSLALNKTVREEITKFILEANPEGLTNIYGALEAAFQDEKIDTIYLLTDGAPTHGKHLQPADILRAVREINRLRRVKINTIGFGLQPEEQKLLEDLAAQNGGVFIAR
ncbi:MAG: HEAT repeat domain-containing protein [Planctomycetes bacterium]|nr:HEAT repeat domain-containing protein [Planctomycetota bacterium]